jgi:hypothetical protein
MQGKRKGNDNGNGNGLTWNGEKSKKKRKKGTLPNQPNWALQSNHNIECTQKRLYWPKMANDMGMNFDHARALDKLIDLHIINKNKISSKMPTGTRSKENRNMPCGLLIDGEVNVNLRGRQAKQVSGVAAWAHSRHAHVQCPAIEPARRSAASASSNLAVSLLRRGWSEQQHSQVK